MAKWKTRDVHQRRMDQICNNIDIGLGYLKEFIDLYKPQHPKLAEAADNIAEILVMAEQFTQALKAAF